MKDLVSVIVPAFNIGKAIGETIESVLQQSYTEFELIIIDDGSTDDTAEHIHRYRDSRLHYWHQSNSGLPSKARNKGIDLSSGKYIAFLDHDDLWLPDKIEKQILVMESDPRTFLVSSNGLYLIGRRMTRRPLFKGLKSGYFDHSNLFPFSRVIQSSVMVRKAAVEELGGFNTAPDMIAVEDYDLWLRIYLKHRCYCLGDCLVYYRVTNTSASRRRIGLSSARYLHYFKHYFPREHFSDEIYRHTVCKILYLLSYHQYLLGDEKYKDALREAAEIDKNTFFYFLMCLSVLPHRWIYPLHFFLRDMRYVLLSIM